MVTSTESTPKIHNKEQHFPPLPLAVVRRLQLIHFSITTLEFQLRKLADTLENSDRYDVAGLYWPDLWGYRLKGKAYCRVCALDGESVDCLDALKAPPILISLATGKKIQCTKCKDRLMGDEAAEKDADAERHERMCARGEHCWHECPEPEKSDLVYCCWCEDEVPGHPLG